MVLWCHLGHCENITKISLHTQAGYAWAAIYLKRVGYRDTCGGVSHGDAALPPAVASLAAWHCTRFSCTVPVPCREASSTEVLPERT